jgi:hypothetical protein
VKRLLNLVEPLPDTEERSLQLEKHLHIGGDPFLSVVDSLLYELGSVRLFTWYFPDGKVFISHKVALHMGAQRLQYIKKIPCL